MRDRMDDSKKNRTEIFHIASSGSDPKNRGGGWFAYANPSTGMDHMVSYNRPLTKEMAMYEAFVAVLEHMKRGTRAQVCTESRVLPRHFERSYGVVEKPLCRLMGRARQIIEDKELEITVKWVPREHIRAAPYLKPHEKEDYSQI